MEVIFKLTAFLRHNCGKLEAMQELSSVFDIPYQDQIDDEGQLVCSMFLLGSFLIPSGGIEFEPACNVRQ